MKLTVKFLLAALVVVGALAFSGISLPPIASPPIAHATLPTASGALSEGPLNANFSSPSVVVGGPANGGFESGLANWTIEGDASRVTTPTSGGQSGGYLKITNAGTDPWVVSDAFVLSDSGSIWSYYAKVDSGSAQMQVSKAPYTTWDQFSASGAGVWQRNLVDLRSLNYVGQTIKVKFRVVTGTASFDEMTWSAELPNWTPSGIAFLQTNTSMPAATPSLGDYSNSEVTCTGGNLGAIGGGGGLAAHLVQNAFIESGVFTIPSGSPRIGIHATGTGIGPAVSVRLAVSSDVPPFSVLHTVYNRQFSAGESIDASCDISLFAGQQAKLRISSSFGGEIDVDTSSLKGWMGQKYGVKRGDPVSIASGAVQYEHTDMSVPGRGIPLAFTRSYTSDFASTPTSLGWGWNDNFDARLRLFTDGSAEVRYPDGATAFFRNVSGTLTPPTGLNDSLVKNVDNTFTLTTTGQIRYGFDVAGKLTTIKDRNSNTTTVAYDGSGYLSSVTEPGGRQFTFTTDGNGRITQIAAPMTRTIGYGYDASGDLVTVTDAAGGVTTFTYENHRLKTITDALTHLVATNTFDSAGRAVEQKDAVNGITCFYYGAGPTYTSANCPGVTATPGQTYVVDPRGTRELHQFDTSFRPTGVERTVDGVDIDTTYIYETSVGTSCSSPAANNGRLCSVTDPLGHVTSYTYDAIGNVLSITDPLIHVQHYTYTALNDVSVANGPRTDVTDTTSHGYDGNGNVTTITDAFSKVTTLNYADAANPGLVTSIVEPDTAGDPVGSHITTFTYDAYGNRTSVKDALNNTTTSAFDLGGRMTSVTDAMTPSRTTLFTYDPRNLLLTVEDPFNGPTHKTAYTYDAVGSRKTVTNARGYTTTYDYDNKRRMITVTDALPTPGVTNYTYDGNDNLATVKDAKQHQALGAPVTYTYDAADRLKKIAYPDIHYYTDYTYDAAGRRLTMTDTRGRCDDVLGCAANSTQSNTTTYTYDNANQLSTVQTTFAGTQLVQYGYDQANNRSSITYPDGKIASYTFDARNRMQTVSASWTTGTSQYFYDDAGRLDYATLPAATGVTEDYGYDVADRLTSVTNTKAGAPPTTLSYANYVLNPNGNRTQLTDTTGVTAYSYDVLDRLSSVTYPAAPTTTTYTYDGVGNRLTQQVDANPATVNTYDEADELKTIGGVTNGFDPNGSLLTIGTGLNLPNTFLYDQENRLFRTGPCRADVNGDGAVNSIDQQAIALHVVGNQGSTKYDLNEDFNADLKVNTTDQLYAAGNGEYGKNCKGTSGNGRSWYDGDGLRVRQRTFTTTGTFAVDNDYVWDAGAGLPVVLQDTRTPKNGTPVTTTYLYGLGLISETSGAGVTSYYLADGLGSTTQLTDSAGAVTDSYSYDVFGTARTTTGTTPNDFRYTGQQRDGNANRGLYYLRARSYDPALGRFLSKDPLPLINRYSYAGNNAANLTDPSGMCGGGWNPAKYLDCPGKFIQHHPDVQRNIVLTADVVALSFTGASAAITDVATIAGCSIGPEGCVVGYGLGMGATTGFRLAGNAASATSTIVACIPPKEGASPGFAKDCGISFAGSFVGATFRDPNLGTGIDAYQFCRDLGKCP